MNIHNISLRAIVAATESEDRVRAALSLFLFDKNIDAIKTEGHYGNPITILDAHIKGRDCGNFIDFLRSNLPEHDIERLKKESCERVDDDCYLHIRLDKQAAYDGIVRLAATPDTISVKLKLKAYPARYDKAVKVAGTIF